MNIQKFILTAALATAAAAVAGSALADQRYPVEAPFVSTKTRAEVVAELKQAGDQARVNYSNSTSAVLQAAGSTKTGAEERAELTTATQDGIHHNVGH